MPNYGSRTGHGIFTGVMKRKMGRGNNYILQCLVFGQFYEQIPHLSELNSTNLTPSAVFMDFGDISVSCKLKVVVSNKLWDRFTIFTYRYKNSK